MNAKQKKRVIKIIQGHATLSSANWDGKGNFCVIGGLLDACGVYRKAGKRRQERFETAGVLGLPVTWQAELEKAFGIDLYYLKEMQNINDRFSTDEGPMDAKDRRTIRERRKALIDYLRKVVTVEE